MPICRYCDAVCDELVIRHERGCPDAWRDARRECLWCGRPFWPRSVYDRFCDDTCGRTWTEENKEARDAPVELGCSAW